MEMVPLIISIVIFLFMLFLGIIIIIGKGDGLIAGYNTASDEEKKEFDIKKLRLVVGIMCIATGIILVPAILGETSGMKILLCNVFIISVCIFGTIMCNTWAKKK